MDELVAEVKAVARLDLLAEPEVVLVDLEAVRQEMRVEPDATGRFHDAEASGERAEATCELDAEAEGALRRRGDGAVVRRLVRVRGVDVGLRERRETTRVVDQLDEVILV